MRITSYVLGFIFDPRYRHLVLVKKNRGPNNMAGKWNAIGGKIEEKESPKDAIKREAFEEAGLKGLVWKKFADIVGIEFECVCFHTTTTNIMIAHYREVDGEIITVCPVEYLHSLSLVSDLPWMMHAAIAHSRDPKNFIHVIRKS